MRIDILFFEGCPNHVPAVRQVRDVVRALGVDAEIREVEVKNPDDATRLHFFGSPTIQMDGKDLDPAAHARTDYSFSCRMYGRLGTPSREMIERALLAGAGH